MVGFFLLSAGSCAAAEHFTQRWDVQLLLKSFVFSGLWEDLPDRFAAVPKYHEEFMYI